MSNVLFMTAISFRSNTEHLPNIFEKSTFVVHSHLNIRSSRPIVLTLYI